MSHFALWNSYMKVYDFLNDVDSYTRSLQDVADAVGARAGMRILDAGSGTGNLSIMLKRRGGDVVSCDFSPAALARHREKDPQACLIETSLENPLPFADKEFEAICCASVLFTLTQNGCRLALREFARVLRPDGRLVLTVSAPETHVGNLVAMYFRALVAKYGAIRGRLRAVWKLPALARIVRYNQRLRRLPDWQGFHYFTEPELLGFLTEAGFEQIAIRRTYGGCFFLATAQTAAALREARGLEAERAQPQPDKESLAAHSQAQSGVVR